MFVEQRERSFDFVGARVVEDAASRGPNGPRPPRPGMTLAEQIDESVAFLDGCFAIKPSEADFRVALAYNMLVPSHVRAAIAGWTTDPVETVAKLGRVTVPTLVSHGRKDSVALPNAAETTASIIRGARLSWYDACGHSPFCEDALRFNAELAAFAK